MSKNPLTPQYDGTVHKSADGSLVAQQTTEDGQKVCIRQVAGAYPSYQISIEGAHKETMSLAVEKTVTDGWVVSYGDLAPDATTKAMADVVGNAIHRMHHNDGFFSPKEAKLFSALCLKMTSDSAARLADGGMSNHEVRGPVVEQYANMLKEIGVLPAPSVGAPTGGNRTR